MKAGSIRHLVRLQRRSDVPSDLGDVDPVWEDVGEMWAGFRPRGGSEVDDGDRKDARQVQQIELRSFPDIDAGMRIIMGTRVFEIQSVSLVDERNFVHRVDAVESGLDAGEEIAPYGIPQSTMDARAECRYNPDKFGCAFNSYRDPDNLNPIGGGIGYTKMVYERDADVVVDSVDAFVDHISGGQSELPAGKILFVPSGVTLDFTGRQEEIQDGIIVASDRGQGGRRGALIVSDTLYDIDGRDSLGEANDQTFLVQNNVRVTGLRFRGPDTERGILGDPNPVVASCALRVDGTNCEIDNNEFTGWSKWNINFVENSRHRVHHNHTYFTRLFQYGYGFWVQQIWEYEGGVQDRSHITIFECNLFEYHRHDLGAAGNSPSGPPWPDKHATNYIFRYNQVLHHEMPNHSVNQHSFGGTREVYRNIFGFKHAAFAGSQKDNEEFSFFENNALDHEIDPEDVTDDSLNDIIWTVSADDKANVVNTVMRAHPFTRGTWRVHQPTVTLTANLTEVIPGQTVKFTAVGTDPDGFGVGSYLWRYDRNQRESHWTERGELELTFNEVGLFAVQVHARSAGVGIVSEAAVVNVFVNEQHTEGTRRDKLAAWWPFTEADGEDRIDAHFGNRLVDTNDSVLLSLSGGAQFDGIASGGFLFIDNINCASLMPWRGSYTVSVWVVPTVPVASTGRNQLNCGLFDLSSAFRVHYDSLMRVFVNATDTEEENTQLTGSLNNLTAGVLNHVVATMDRDAGEIRLYINGVLDATKTATLTIDDSLVYSQGRLNVGFETNTSGQYYIGDMRELCVFRRAFDQSDVDWHYNGGTPQTYEQSGRE